MPLEKSVSSASTLSYTGSTEDAPQIQCFFSRWLGTLSISSTSFEILMPETQPVKSGGKEVYSLSYWLVHFARKWLFQPASGYCQAQQSPRTWCVLYRSSSLRGLSLGGLSVADSSIADSPARSFAFLSKVLVLLFAPCMDSYDRFVREASRPDLRRRLNSTVIGQGLSALPFNWFWSASGLSMYVSHIVFNPFCKLTRSSHKLVQLVQLSTFGIKHTTKAQCLADMRLNLFDDIVIHCAMVASEEGLCLSRGNEEQRARQSTQLNVFSESLTKQCLQRHAGLRREHHF